MTEPMIVKLKPHKMTVKALKSNGKYKNITGIFKGVLIIYTTMEDDIMKATTTITGELQYVIKPWTMPKDKDLEEL